MTSANLSALHAARLKLASLHYALRAELRNVHRDVSNLNPVPFASIEALTRAQEHTTDILRVAEEIERALAGASPELETELRASVEGEE
jgi:hypothetical protein